MKRPFMVWIGFISICCSKVAKEGKSCPRLLVLQRVAQNAKSCLLAGLEAGRERDRETIEISLRLWNSLEKQNGG